MNPALLLNPLHSLRMRDNRQICGGLLKFKTRQYWRFLDIGSWWTGSSLTLLVRLDHRLYLRRGNREGTVLKAMLVQTAADPKAAVVNVNALQPTCIMSNLNYFNVYYNYAYR